MDFLNVNHQQKILLPEGKMESFDSLQASKEEDLLKDSKGAGEILELSSRYVEPFAPKSADGRRKSQEEIVAAPLTYLSSFPGKDFRGRFISAFNELFKIPEEKLTVIKSVVGILHTASLLIDDIEDSSSLRRGYPVAHRLFGIPQTLNSANSAYFNAQEQLLQLGNPEALRVFTKELLALHKGQGMDLYWRDTLTCPSEAEYLDMIVNKTGGLFRLAVRLMQLESEISLDCIPFVDLLGTIFQISDDYNNLQNDSYTQNKGFGEDITEGKFSFPIVHSIRHGQNGPGLMNILQQRTEDENVKRVAIKILESSGSFEYCRQRLVSLTEEARFMQSKMGTLGDTSGLESILGYLQLKQPIYVF